MAKFRISLLPLHIVQHKKPWCLKVGSFYQIYFHKRAWKFNLNREYFRHPALYNIYLMSWKTIQGEQKLASGWQNNNFLNYRVLQYFHENKYGLSKSSHCEIFNKLTSIAKICSPILISSLETAGLRDKNKKY